MEGVYELCQSAEGGLLFQAAQGWSTGAFLDLQPRDQARTFSLAPLFDCLKGAANVESQARDAVDLLAGAAGTAQRAQREGHIQYNSAALHATA